jgi:hypothetical protein
MSKNKTITVKKEEKSRIDLVIEATGCSVFSAQIALNKRRNDVELAVEYLKGLKFSPSEGDYRRYPKWTALLDKEANEVSKSE